MKIFHYTIIAMNLKNWSLLFIPLVSACQSSAPEEGQLIFDCTTLAGWEGATEFFHVESGSIVAGSAAAAIPQNEFLCTEMIYREFELLLEARLTGEGKNAGVQFRSERIPDDHEVIGYQYDIGFMDGRPIWASLYDESRRNKFLLHPPESEIAAILKPNDWNELKMRCKGAEINFWLNGKHVLTYMEDDGTIARSGKICLQIHSGPQAEASYRNIRIKEL